MTKANDEQPTGDNEVGYGRPPKKSQFKPGQSGNPKGRPKGAKNLKSIVEKEAYSIITIREGGKARKTTKIQALAMAMMNKGIQGDVKAGQLFFALARDYLSPEDLQAIARAPLSEKEQEFLRNHAKFLEAIEGASDE